MTLRRRTLLAAGAAFSLAGPARAAGPPFTVDAYVLVRIFQAAIEGHMASMARTLRAIAASKSADSVTWADAAPALRQVTEVSPTTPVAWLATPDGAYSTTFDDGPAADSLKDRSYFRQLMAQREVSGHVMVSTVSGQRVSVGGAPVVRAGRVIGAVGVETSCRRIMEVVDAYYRLPQDLVFLVINDAALIVLHSEHDRIFQTPDLSEPSMAAAVRRIIAEPSGTLSYTARGMRRLAAFNRSDILGWHFMVARTLS